MKTILTFKADGTTSTFAFSFDYLQKNFVVVKKDGIVLTYGTDYTVVDKQVFLTVTPEKDSIIRIQRCTTTDRIVSWSDASVLRSYDLSIFEIQLLHLAEETADKTQEGGMAVDEIEGAWDARLNRIKNVGIPEKEGDAVNLKYITEIQTGIGQAKDAALEVQTYLKTLKQEVQDETEGAREQIEKNNALLDEISPKMDSIQEQAEIINTTGLQVKEQAEIINTTGLQVKEQATSIQKQYDEIQAIRIPLAAQATELNNFAASLAKTAINKKIFTTSGTFVVPSDVTTVYVTAVGGGAGGSLWYGCGGASGQGCLKHALTVHPNESIPITVGAGGAVPSVNWIGSHDNQALMNGARQLNGNAGQDTLIGTYLTLKGGTGATIDSRTVLTPGVGASRGDICSVYFTHATGAFYKGGQGGSSIFGNGGLGGFFPWTAISHGPGNFYHGEAPLSYGAGGGGGGSYVESSLKKSCVTQAGAGAPGIVIIEW